MPAYRQQTDSGQTADRQQTADSRQQTKGSRQTADNSRQRSSQADEALSTMGGRNGTQGRGAIAVA